jgi:outer membrane protein assembly factor BamE (lipoprotein component of BamABCDE complex)
MLAVGCGNRVLYQRFDRQMWTNFANLQNVKPGMSRTEVEGIMGRPGIKEEGDYRGGHYAFYFYLTHSMDFEESNTVRGGYAPPGV